MNKRSDLWDILFLIRKSCVLTLVYKHGIKSAPRIFKKYGKYFRVKNKLGQNISELTYFKTLKTFVVEILL